MVTKAAVRAWLEERFLLRLHMTLILGGTFLAGVVMTRLLMMAGVNHLALRYVIAVTGAYFAFLVLIRLWLAYVGSTRDHLDVAGELVEAAIDGADSGGSAFHVSSARAPRFQGGGSKGSWRVPDLDLGDADDALVIVVLVAVIVCLCGFAIYFIYTAPALLSEAAFEALLAGALAQRTKKATGPGWIGAVWRMTVWPFLIVLVLSGVLGWVAQRRCPEATRLRDALGCARDIPPPPTGRQPPAAL